MGLYINHLADGTELPKFDKANFLVQMAGAKRLKFPFAFQPDLVCVVENGEFDAAAYIDSELELVRFGMPRRGDNRPKHWLVVPGAGRLAR